MMITLMCELHGASWKCFPYYGEEGLEMNHDIVLLLFRDSECSSRWASHFSIN